MIKQEINLLYKEIYQQLKDIQNGTRETFKYDIIKMSSARITGKTYTALLFSILLGTIKKTHTYAIRLVKNEIRKTLMTETEKILKGLQINFKTHGTHLEATYGNGSKITFLGLKTSRKEKMSLTGLGGNELYEYGSIVKDEIGEWTEQENNEVDEAIRGFKPKRVIEWWTNNPIKETNWFSMQFWDKIRENHPDFETLQMKNNFIKIFEKEKLFNVLYITSTYKVNRWADLRVINKLKWQLEYDPQRARTTALGLPGVGNDGIYNPILQVFNETVLIEIQKENIPHEKILKYTLGIDYGWIDKTAVVLLVITNQRIIILDLFVYDRKKDPLISDLKLAVMIANKIIFWNSYYKINFLAIKFDYTNHTFMQLIQNQLDKKIDKERMSVQGAMKQKIEIRIQVVNGLFAINKIYYNHSNFLQINELFKEFRSATYKPMTTEKIRKDGNDDCINAFEYSLSGQDENNIINTFFKKADNFIYTK